MQLPSILQGPSLTRLVQGAIFGAILSIVVGFNWGGWVLGSTASKNSAIFADNAVADALAPICADRFQNASDASSNLATFQGQNSYKQTGFIEEGGWASFAGHKTSDRDIATACAAIISQVN